MQALTILKKFFSVDMVIYAAIVIVAATALLRCTMPLSRVAAKLRRAQKVRAQGARALDHELPVHVKVCAAVGPVHKPGLRSKGDFVDKRRDGFVGKSVRRELYEDGIGLILHLL